MPTPKTTVLIPTYDERESLPGAIAAVLDAAPHVTILVIDDASPDGTGEVADAIAARDERVRVLHRAGKQGLGTAYVAGMRRALEEGAELVVEMDADGSHPASALPSMLAAAANAELVIGSRWVPGGDIVDWPVHRELISRFGNLYARIMLGLSANDVTAGYRVYRADALRRIDLDAIESQGYCFQVDMTRRVADAGGRIVEVPIVFRERVLGRSKMTGGIVGEAFVKVGAWGIGRRAAGASAALRGLKRTLTSP